MAQLSRPYQIAIAAAVAVLGLFAVWSLVLHHSSSSEPVSAGSSAPSGGVAAANRSAASSSGADEGLGSAVEKAHAAVSESQQNARQLENRSAAASGEAPAAHPTQAPAQHSTQTPAQHSTQTPAAAHALTRSHALTSRRALAPAHRTHAARISSAKLKATLAAAIQVLQEIQLKQELAQGKTILLLFWTPKSSGDVEVYKQMQAVAAHLKGRVATHVALPEQVGRYSSVTRDVQIFQTPTLMIIDKKGQAATLTGLVDRYAIEQAIQEIQKA